MKLIDIYDNISSCPDFDNDVSGQILASCNGTPAKSIEVSLDSMTEFGIIKICKIGVFGEGGVTDEDRPGYVSPEEKARLQAEAEAQVRATARTDY